MGYMVSSSGRFAWYSALSTGQVQFSAEAVVYTPPHRVYRVVIKYACPLLPVRHIDTLSAAPCMFRGVFYLINIYIFLVLNIAGKYTHTLVKRNLCVPFRLCLPLSAIVLNHRFLSQLR